MTPEKIYKKYIDCPDTEWTTWELKGNFLEDVSKYAEQEALAFAQYIAEYGWEM